jgi:hypothetical protein
MVDYEYTTNPMGTTTKKQKQPDAEQERLDSEQQQRTQREAEEVAMNVVDNSEHVKKTKLFFGNDAEEKQAKKELKYKFARDDIDLQNKRADFALKQKEEPYKLQKKEDERKAREDAARMKLIENADKVQKLRPTGYNAFLKGYKEVMDTTNKGISGIGSKDTSFMGRAFQTGGNVRKIVDKKGNVHYLPSSSGGGNPMLSSSGSGLMAIIQSSKQGLANMTGKFNFNVPQSNINIPQTNLNFSGQSQGETQSRQGQKYFKTTSRTGKVYYRLMEQSPNVDLSQSSAPQVSMGGITPTGSFKVQNFLGMGNSNSMDKIRAFTGSLSANVPAQMKIALFTGKMNTSNPMDKILSFTKGFSMPKIGIKKYLR